MSTKKLYIAAMTSLILTSAYVANTPAFAQTSTFQDVPKSNAHYVGITELAKKGIVSGATSTQFKPYENATRAEAAMYLAKALKLDMKNVKNPGLKDVPQSATYYGAVAALHELGIIDGFSDGTFKPNDTLKRSQFAKMLSLGFDLKLAKATNSKFADVNNIDDIATKRYILTLVNYNITNGTTATTFSPYVTLKRGQLATFLYRAMQAADNEFKVISVQ